MPVRMSKWDRPGVAAFVDGCWDAEDEVKLRQDVASWVGKGIGTLLDVGCGSARMAPLLRGWSYTGVDSSAEMLRLAKKRAPKATLMQSDIRRLPFENGQFTTALCMEVLRHLDSYQDVLQELCRVSHRTVYIVDAFSAAKEHLLGRAEVAGQTFADNSWSLNLFLQDVAPDWESNMQSFGVAVGVKLLHA